ncbi:hypothetical protein FGE12_21515 [Aggregicoccus sp. 17bor-14]|uniref:ORC-CDC6 family AAA ATPase n=1 Tax=Myxococcaceae TaxID=31 RepID=UPI00129CF746|nr:MULTISPECIES: hypothetical protein [Myxococcaceae]MBF5044995.1 hypothetical protein [Simulacricoccus sp. 17bor-14]MRI90738.1 hypothetical protein [Aggregicoccus sp. 17bor-14]
MTYTTGSPIQRCPKRMRHSKPNPFRLRRVERMRPDEVISTYCPPETQFQLDDARHVILQGPRGSGKSTILRNIAESPSALKGAVSPEGELLVGTYVTVAQQWVAAYQRRGWLPSAQRDVLFIQGFNLLIAQQFAQSLSRLAHFVCDAPERAASVEARLVKNLWERFFTVAPPTGVEVKGFIEHCKAMQRELRDVTLRAAFAPGETPTLPTGLLLSELFEPFGSLISDIDISAFLPRPPLWVFAFDELDNLSEEQQVLFNTVLRNVSRPIAIKGACLPHGHRTLKTQAEDNPVMPGEDFEYVALSLDPKSVAGKRFALRLYATRLAGAGATDLPKSPVQWLGDTSIRHRATTYLEKRFKGRTWEDVIPSLSETAPPLPERKINADSARQYVPALAMRLLRRAATGNASVTAYAGWTDVMAASDGNPRRLLRLLDRLYEASEGATTISPEQQSSVIRSVADSAFDRLVALPRCGRWIQDWVDALGTKLEERLHSGRRLRRDSCSISLNLASLTATEASAVQTAIAYGVLFPWAFDPRSGYPTGDHDYWLSFGLAPRYWLVLRKGKPIDFNELSNEELPIPADGQLQLSLESSAATPQSGDDE